MRNVRSRVALKAFPPWTVKGLCPCRSSCAPTNGALPRQFKSNWRFASTLEIGALPFRGDLLEAPNQVMLMPYDALSQGVDFVAGVPCDALSQGAVFDGGFLCYGVYDGSGGDSGYGGFVCYDSGQWHSLSWRLQWLWWMVTTMARGDSGNGGFVWFDTFVLRRGPTIRFLSADAL